MTAFLITIGIIIGVIILGLLAVLFLPVKVKIKFYEDFILKVSFLGIKVYEISPENQKKEKNDEKPKKKKTDNKITKDNKAITTAKNIFVKLKKKYGFAGAVREIISFLYNCLLHIKKLMKHIKISSVKLDITVASDDAAKTAIDYGMVCQAVYPVTAMLAGQNIGFKEINVKTDFESNEGSFGFDTTVKMQIFYLIIAAFRIYKQYQNFITEMDKNERKQS